MKYFSLFFVWFAKGKGMEIRYVFDFYTIMELKRDGSL